MLMLSAQVLFVMQEPTKTLMLTKSKGVSR